MTLLEKERPQLPANLEGQAEVPQWPEQARLWYLKGSPMTTTVWTMKMMIKLNSQ